MIRFLKKAIKKQKRHVTLLETLIAMTLLSMLLLVIFGFFRELTVISQMTLSKQKEAFQMRLVESRLAFLFERIVYDSTKERQHLRKFYFFSEPPNGAFSDFPSLVFTFNNEIRRDASFSGDILARLYVDKKNRLCLATWPIYDENPHEAMQTEILLEEVKNIDFEFYMPPPQLKGTHEIYAAPIEAEKKTPERDTWHKNEWLNSYEQMPAIIKLILNVEEQTQNSSKKGERKSKEIEDWVFAYVLPTRKNYIYYPPN